MSEKKVVVFLVEGASDEAALGTAMTEYFSSNEVRFIVVHGDITLKDYVSADSILKRINEQIESIMNKYRYNITDFLRIIHITDMDGVYISPKDVKEADISETLYYTDRIETGDVQGIIRRNKKKSEILFKLQKTGKIHNIPYRIYYNSCNLEHVLFGELRVYTDEEKQELSDDFADRFEGKIEEFIEFISSPGIAVSGSYQKTWDYIQVDMNSLNRHSNMHLMFEEQ